MDIPWWFWLILILVLGYYLKFYQPALYAVVTTPVDSVMRSGFEFATASIGKISFVNIVMQNTSNGTAT